MFQARRAHTSTFRRIGTLVHEMRQMRQRFRPPRPQAECLEIRSDDFIIVRRAQLFAEHRHHQFRDVHLFIRTSGLTAAAERIEGRAPLAAFHQTSAEVELVAGVVGFPLQRRSQYLGIACVLLAHADTGTHAPIESTDAHVRQPQAGYRRRRDQNLVQHALPNPVDIQPHQAGCPSAHAVYRLVECVERPI